MRSIQVPVLAILALSGVTSCGANRASPGPVAPEPESAAVAPAVHVPWGQAKRGQRIDYMVHTVLPRMKAEFVAFDPKRFARMNCATCHGDSADDGSYTSPSPKLPKLVVDGSFAKHRQLTPEITRFMLEKVEPDMAALLEKPVYDPTTHQGFGCFDCHTRDASP